MHKGELDNSFRRVAALTRTTFTREDVLAGTYERANWGPLRRSLLDGVAIHPYVRSCANSAGRRHG